MRYGTRIKEYFRRRVARTHDVADLVQDTFARCQKGTFRGEGSVAAYILGIGHNVFLEYLRRLRRQEGKLSDDELLEHPISDFGSDPEFILHQKREIRHVMKAMRRIPLRYQIVLEMSLWEELKQAEIAEILARPPSTVRRWKTEAITAIEGKMQALATSPELQAVTTMTIASWRRWISAESEKFPTQEPQQRLRDRERT